MSKSTRYYAISLYANFRIAVGAVPVIGGIHVNVTSLIAILIDVEMTGVDRDHATDPVEITTKEAVQGPMSDREDANTDGYQKFYSRKL